MDRPGMNELSQRELDVAGLLADGLTDAEIGARLGLAPPAVTAIIEQFILWLGVQDRAQVAGWALGLGLQHGGGYARESSALSVTTPEVTPEPPDPTMDAPVPWWRRWLSAAYG